MKKNKKINLKLNLWLERDEEIYIGMGIIMILIRIKKLGSLRKAAIDLHMSYRAAWGKLKTAEKRIKSNLVQKVPNKGQIYELSEFGEEIIEKFLNFYKDVEDFALKRANEIFSEQIGKDRDTRL